MQLHNVLAAFAALAATASAQQRCNQDNCVRFVSTGQVSAFCTAFTNNRWTYAELPTAYNACPDRAALSSGCSCVFPAATAPGVIVPTTYTGPTLGPTTTIIIPVPPSSTPLRPDTPNTPVQPPQCNPTFTVTRNQPAVTQTVYVTGPGQTAPRPSVETSVTTVSGVCSPSRFAPVLTSAARFTRSSQRVSCTDPSPNFTN
jgi:hypothetical protein